MNGYGSLGKVTKGLKAIMPLVAAVSRPSPGPASRLALREDKLESPAPLHRVAFPHSAPLGGVFQINEITEF
jgi:hypothetical protein